MFRESANVKTIERDLGTRPSQDTILISIINGAWEKGKPGEVMFLTKSNYEKLIGKPKIGSDHAYFILESYFTFGGGVWSKRVLGSNYKYGGLLIPSSYTLYLGEADGITTSFEGYFSPNRLPENAKIELILGKSKIGYGNGVVGDTTITIMSSFLNVGEVDTGSDASSTTPGRVMLEFNSPPPAGAKIYVRWYIEEETPVSLSSLDGLDWVFPTNTFDLTDLSSNYYILTLRVSGGSCNDYIVPTPLYLPDNITNENDSPILIYDGNTLIGYVNIAGNIVDMGTYFDANATNEVNFETGNIQFTLNSSYTPTNQLVAYFKSQGSFCMLVGAESPGDWADDFSSIVKEVDLENGYFTLSVFEKSKDGIWFENETFTELSLSTTLMDTRGAQSFAPEKVNGKSYYIEVRDNPFVDENFLPAISMRNDTSYNYQSMYGGDKGNPPSVGDYINALDEFRSKEKYDAHLIISTCEDVLYQNELIKLSDRELYGGRGIFAITYVPYDVAKASDPVRAISDFMNYSILKSSFNETWCEWVKVYDSYNKREVEIPVVGFAGSWKCRTVETEEPWFAAAGWRRGLLPVLDLFPKLDKTQRDMVYSAGANPCKFKRGKGIALWGNRTTYNRDSALQDSNCRLGLIFIENAIEEFLEDFEFEFNDAYTRKLVTTMCDSYFSFVKGRRGLYDYAVICDESNNPPEVIDSRQMYVDFYLELTRAAEVIVARYNIVPTGFTRVFVKMGQ